jgi:hypothetical protein
MRTEVSIVSGIVAAGIALLFIRRWALDQRLNRLSRLDAKVDALLKEAGTMLVGRRWFGRGSSRAQRQPARR